jgi:outer membrane cobalamin receptor
VFGAFHAEGGSMICRVSGPARRSFPLASIAVILVLALAAAPAFAQAVRGRVVDPETRAVASAVVLIVKGTQVVTTTRTAADGTFGPVTVAPGEYEVIVGAPGWRADPKRVTVTADGVADVEVGLAIGAVSESVVVSAAQVELPLSRATDSVTVIEQQELRTLQVETVSQAMRFVPGFGVVQQGGRGALTSLFPRGGESDYTLVVQDGIPLNAFGGGFDAAHLAAGQVERVEVVRGPQSALYGGGAIGGILQVVTRHGGPLRANALVEFGGYGTAATSIGAAGSRGAWSWGATLDWLDTDGNTSDRANLGRAVANDDYSRVAAAANVTWSDRADRRVRVDVLAGYTDRGFPGPYGSDPLGLYAGLDLVSRGTNEIRGVRASALFGSGRTFRHGLQLTFTDAPSTFDSPDFFDPAVVNTRRTDTSRVTGRYQVDIERKRVGLSAGSEFLLEQEQNSLIRDTTSEEIPVERQIAGFFVESRLPFDERAFLTAGLRVERIERSKLAAGEFGRPAFDGSDVVWSANPKVSGAWFVRPAGGQQWTKIRAGAGTGIKPPTAFEIAFTNNPGLKPERSRSFDAGVEQALAGSRLVADATFFANRFDDLIVTVGRRLAGASAYQSDNIANARAKGLEIGARWQGTRGLAARVAYTWLDTEVMSVDHLASPIAPAPYAVGDPLVRRPRHQASAAVTWSAARGQAFFLVNGRGAMNDLEPTFASSVYLNPGYAVVAVGGAVSLARNIEVYARVSNLFDKEYEEAFGYPALGRTALVGVRVATGR